MTQPTNPHTQPTNPTTTTNPTTRKRGLAPAGAALPALPLSEPAWICVWTDLAGRTSPDRQDRQLLAESIHAHQPAAALWDATVWSASAPGPFRPTTRPPAGTTHSHTGTDADSPTAPHSPTAASLWVVADTTRTASPELAATADDACGHGTTAHWTWAQVGFHAGVLTAVALTTAVAAQQVCRTAGADVAYHLTGGGVAVTDPTGQVLDTAPLTPRARVSLPAERWHRITLALVDRAIASHP
ncbi:MAG: hypothetical protein JJU45_08045 [Acidimicrobiia bacterium]|nr:hypothetical protein [Acidimicrobiia bacterium]